MSNQLLVNTNPTPNESSQEVPAVSPAIETTSETTSATNWSCDTTSSSSCDGNENDYPASGKDLSAQNTKVKETTGIFEIIRKYASVSDLLRLSGAIAVAVAMGLFLLDGIKELNDLWRFLTMLGLTGALTAAGLAMSLLLKEQRGSRVFISLALLSVPVSFTVIGALLYSVMPFNTLAPSYPGYAHWQAGSLSDLALSVVAGLAVLGPVIWLGFSVLARSARNWLSIAMVASSTILLIPVRAEIWSAGLAVGMTTLLWLAYKRHSENSLALKTTEGKLAVALLFVAPVIVAARSLFFYDVNGVLVLVLSAGFFAYCRYILLTYGKTANSKTGLVKTDSDNNVANKPGALSAVLTLLTSAAILGVCLSWGNLLSNFLPEAWALFIASIGLLFLSNDLVRVSPNPVLSGVIGLIFAGLSTLALIATTYFSSGTMLCVALALASIVAYGLYFKINRATLIGGIGLLILFSLNISELLRHAHTIWTSALMTGWWGIAAVGALAIIAGSMIDRAGTVVKVKEDEQ